MIQNQTQKTLFIPAGRLSEQWPAYWSTEKRGEINVQEYTIQAKYIILWHIIEKYIPELKQQVIYIKVLGSELYTICQYWVVCTWERPFQCSCLARYKCMYCTIHIYHCKYNLDFILLSSLLLPCPARWYIPNNFFCQTIQTDTA